MLLELSRVSSKPQLDFVLLKEEVEALHSCLNPTVVSDASILIYSGSELLYYTMPFNPRCLLTQDAPP